MNIPITFLLSINSIIISILPYTPSLDYVVSYFKPCSRYIKYIEYVDITIYQYIDILTYQHNSISNISITVLLSINSIIISVSPDN